MDVVVASNAVRSSFGLYAGQYADWPYSFVLRYVEVREAVQEVYRGAAPVVSWRGEFREGKMKTFLICPMRGHDPTKWESFVDELEKIGWEVYWPPRDTVQEDPTGLRICRANREAIQEADAVHIIWDGESQGVLFDLGMAFALDKEIVALELPPLIDGKSFQNMIVAWMGEDYV